jgi:hypothetical protein
MWYKIQVAIQVYPDTPKTPRKILDIHLEANDDKYLRQYVEGAIARFYEDEMIGLPRDDEGNFTDDFKQFFENQVEWRIL